MKKSIKLSESEANNVDDALLMFPKSNGNGSTDTDIQAVLNT